MSTSQAVARSISSGGHGIPWLFYLPAMLLALLVVNAILGNPSPRSGAIVAIVNTGVVLLVTFIWYFLLSRIPNFREVRNIKRQVPDAQAVFGLDVLTVGGVQPGVRAVFGRSRPTSLIASPAGIQIWAGAGDSAFPLKEWKWNEVPDATLSGRWPWSNGVVIWPSQIAAPVTLSLRSNRLFAFIRVRGRARVRVIQQLESLRRASNGEEMLK